MAGAQALEQRIHGSEDRPNCIEYRTHRQKSVPSSRGPSSSVAVAGRDFLQGVESARRARTLPRGRQRKNSSRTMHPWPGASETDRKASRTGHIGGRVSPVAGAQAPRLRLRDAISFGGASRLGSPARPPGGARGRTRREEAIRGPEDPEGPKERGGPQRLKKKNGAWGHGAGAGVNT